MIIEAIKGMKELADTAGIKITELSLDTESFCRLDTEIQLSDTMNKPIEVFMVDPPWPKLKGGKRKVRPNQGRDLDYNTMPVCDIFTLLDTEIFPLSSTNYNVFLWTVDQFMLEAEQQMQRRGYKLHARLIWNKMNGIAPAFSIRYTHEYLLWYYKPPFIPVAANVRGKFTSVFTEKARQHSRKPDIAYNMIEAMYPTSAKMDVFSREYREGWSQFGDQIGMFGEKQV